MSDSSDSATKARAPHWYGILCTETHNEIAERMRDVLSDHYFTMVIGNSYDENSELFRAIEVYPSQWLTHPVKPYWGNEYLGIHWTTPSLSMGVHTRAKTPAEARAGKPHEYVHFTFERDRIVIHQYAPAGYFLEWIFAVERHDRDEYR